MYIGHTASSFNIRVYNLLEWLRLVITMTFESITGTTGHLYINESKSLEEYKIRSGWTLMFEPYPYPTDKQLYLRFRPCSHGMVWLHWYCSFARVAVILTRCFCIAQPIKHVPERSIILNKTDTVETLKNRMAALCNVAKGEPALIRIPGRGKGLSMS